jgi:hypothetical protein
MNHSFIEIDYLLIAHKFKHTYLKIYGSLVWHPHFLPMLSQIAPSTSQHYPLPPALSHSGIGQ